MVNSNWLKDRLSGSYFNNPYHQYIEITNPVTGKLMKVSCDPRYATISGDVHHYEQEVQNAIVMLFQDSNLLFEFILSNENVLGEALNMIRKKKSFKHTPVKPQEDFDPECDKEYEDALIVVEHYDENGIKDESDQEEYDIHLEIVKKYEGS